MRAGLMSSTVMLSVVGTAMLLGAPPAKNLTALATFRNAGTDAVKSTLPLSGGISNGIFQASVAAPASSGTEVTLPAYLPDTYECDTAPLARCNKDPQSGALDLATFQVAIKPILDLGTDYNDVPGGLTGMACSGESSSSSALVNYTFWIGVTEGHWGLNANPRYHADAATVARTSRTTWIVTGISRAELISFGHSRLLRKSGPSHEGQYILPFQITITANAPVTATCP